MADNTIPIKPASDEKPAKTPGRRLALSVVFLVGAVIYTISPIDLIPDFLGPLGWIDDIGVCLAAVGGNLFMYIRHRWQSHNESVSKMDRFI
jgi:uncharacterized membrane protein YkvA (DUF1232 family)